jgi:hypothetical protein
MFLGFGWLTVEAVLELVAYPPAPRAITAAEAARLAHPGRGAWVAFTDLRLPCAWAPVSPPTSPYVYYLGTGPGGGERIVVAHDYAKGDLRCSQQPAPLVGVLSAGKPGRIVDLDFAAAPWATWPTPYQITLWTGRGPSDARGGIIFMPPMTLLGLFVAIGYFRTGSSGRRPSERPGPAVAVVGGTILPARPLSLSAAHARGAWFGIGFLVVAGAMMVTLPIGMLVANDGDVPSGLARAIGRWLLLGFPFVIGLFLFFLAFALWRSRRRDARLTGELREHVVPLLAVEEVLAKDVDVGNRRYVYRHPTTAETRHYVAGPPDRPLVVAGHILVVHAVVDERHLVIVCEGFEPFVLTDDERARALDAFRARTPPEG